MQTDEKRSTTDLPNYAAETIQRVLQHVAQLAYDDDERLRVNLAAAAVCLGQAGATWAKMEGCERDEATLQVLEILRILTADGVDAVQAYLNRDRESGNGAL